MELVMRNYWWPEVTRNVGKYIKKWNLYQRIKNRTKELAGKNIVLVVCDMLSKIVYFVATTEETLTKGLVRLFRDNGNCMGC